MQSEIYDLRYTIYAVISDIDAGLNTKRDQKWIDEALASGPATPLTKKEMDAIFKKALKGRAA